MSIWERAEVPQWKRVLPVGSRFTNRGGSVLVLSSIDVWSDRITLNFAYEVPTFRLERESSQLQLSTYQVTENEGHPIGGPAWSVSDDLGTQYRLVSGSSGGTELSFGTASFSPAIPEAASRLFVSSPERADAIEINL